MRSRFVRMGIFGGLIVTIVTAALLMVALTAAQAQDPQQGEVIAAGANPFDPLLESYPPPYSVTRHGT